MYSLGVVHKWRLSISDSYVPLPLPSRLFNNPSHNILDFHNFPKFAVVVNTWSLFIGSFMLMKMGPQYGGRCMLLV